MGWKFLKNVDFCTGALFLALGAGTALLARTYPLGTPMRMEAGFVPLLLGAVLCVIGLLLMLRALSTGGDLIEPVVWRPLALITLAVVLFGLGVDRIGLVAMTILCVVITRAAAPMHRRRETALIGLSLAALVVAVFVYGLSIPFKVWPV